MGKTIAAYGGGFKPPTSGHFEVVKQALKDFPEIDEFIIYVGGGERDGISQPLSILIWEIYQTHLPMKVRIEPSKAPIGDIIRLGKNNPQDTIYFVIGAREQNEEDLKDVSSRTKGIEEKYPNMKIKLITTTGGVSGTNARKAAKVSPDEFYKFLPSELNDSEREEVYNIVKPSIKETLNENASYSKDIDVKSRIMQLTQHMLDKGYNIEPLPTVEFVNGDSENARDFLGKTAYYNPENQTIVLYTEGRHPKDIVRSFAHEMIHHVQNLEGRLGNITTTNTQEDDELNKIEAEANLKGTMTFRNWTDSLNENKITPDDVNRILKRTGDEQDLTEPTWDEFTPEVCNNGFCDIFAEKFREEYPGAEIWNTYWSVGMTMGHVWVKYQGKFYDAEAPNGVDDWRKLPYIQKIFKARGKYPDDVERLAEAIVGNKIVCDNCGWSWNVKDGGDDLYICHKCGHDNTPINELNKPYKHKHGFDDKLGKDPFGLNQFAREVAEGVLNEGKYDKFVNEISKVVFEMFKDIHDRGDEKGEFEFSIGPDDEDIYSNQFEFDLAGVVKISDDEYSVDGGANAGFANDGTEITPLLSVSFIIPKNPDWQKVSFDIKDVVRHELEHLTQGGDNEKSGKYMEDDQLVRDLIDADMLPKSQYFKLEKEVDAMLQGLYFKAKKSKTPFKDVVDEYLNIFLNQGTITQEEKEDILNIWRSRIKALSLPVLEIKKKVMDYEIYSDMDGVLTDFDASFMKSSGGILPSEYEKNFGKDGFWELIDGKGVGFWVGMPWMQDGKQYWDYIKEYTPILLSSPSRSSTSRLGKRLWVRNNLPGTKLILAQAKDKQNYAQSNRILIDDRPSNIDQWRSKGGIGILHTSAADTIRQLKELGI